MNKQIASEMLRRSILNLQERRGQLTISDIETEVINNACLAILKQEGVNPTEAFLIAEMFTDGAKELFPEYYKEPEALAGSFGIQRNVVWDGMWNFLREYFEKNHGIRIDDSDITYLTFHSTNHKRYENGELTSESDVERVVNLSLSNDGKEVLVSIEPSLSPKKAFLQSEGIGRNEYAGEDPDYLFTIQYDDFYEIETFILEMPNRRLKIVYFE